MIRTHHLNAAPHLSPMRKRISRIAACLCLLLFEAASLRSFSPGGDRIVGGEFRYRVRKGDSLALVGARFAVDPGLLARANGLSAKARLSVGQSLRIDNRHIVPAALDEGILINLPQRILYLFHEGALVAWYPVGLGRPDWQTVIGRFRLVQKEREPTWDVPLSIQKEMRERGERVRTKVPPGPDNPLGHYFLRLSESACGIHGTIAPSSVYTFRTHGCIRLHPDDIVDLFGRVSVGTPVWIAYEPILLAEQTDGSVFLEVNPDVYRRAGDPSTTVAGLAAQQGLALKLHPAGVDAVCAAEEGVARRVDAPAP